MNRIICQHAYDGSGWGEDCYCNQICKHQSKSILDSTCYNVLAIGPDVSGLTEDQISEIKRSREAQMAGTERAPAEPIVKD